jgi:hypothetical protein
MSTTVTGNLKTLAATVDCTHYSVYMVLQWKSAVGAIPRVNGTALLVDENVACPIGVSSSRPAIRLTINTATGAITGTVYSTRDAAGTGDGEIDLSGSKIACWYDVVVLKGSDVVVRFSVHAKNGATLDLTSVTPITTSPVVTAPTGDSTYARLDGGNTPFTAIIQFLQGIILGAGKLLTWGSVGTGTVDTGLSRIAAKVIAIGNGTQGDTTGSLALGGAIPASAGTIRLANGNNIAVRNPGNTADLTAVLSSGSGFSFGANAEIVTSGVTTIQASGAVPRFAIPQNPGFNTLGARSDGVYGWSPTTTPSTAADTGLSRTAAATVAVGNGTAADASGTLKAAKLNNGADLTIPATGTAVVSDTATQTLSAKTLQGAGSGNAVTLLNAQGPLAAVVGTGADATLYTFTIPANVIGAGKGIRVTVVSQKTTGTGIATYKLKFGATTIESPALTQNSNVNPDDFTYRILNNSGVQNAQNWTRLALFVSAGATSLGGASGTSAENSANALTISWTFSAAGTEQVTPKQFIVELIQ